MVGVEEGDVPFHEDVECFEKSLLVWYHQPVEAKQPDKVSADHITRQTVRPVERENYLGQDRVGTVDAERFILDSSNDRARLR